jgi:hypothetical protein
MMTTDLPSSEKPNDPQSSKPLNEQSEKQQQRASHTEDIVDGGITKDDDDREEQHETHYTWFRPFVLTALTSLILAWWISATVLKVTRHQW